MSAPKEFYDNLTARLIVASVKHDNDLVDNLLDVWFDVTYRATEYDGKLWELDKEQEMIEIADQISRKASLDNKSII